MSRSKAGPSKKRPRRDSGAEDGSDPTPDTKSSMLWFDDGNVVLKVEKTLFRVHRSMLSIHSTVLSDMFSVPQPETDEDTLIEGCPVVKMEDRAVDWENLLKVFYYGVSLWNSSDVPSSAMIAAMLRLGHKYDIVGCREDALVRLQSYFPKTLEGFWNLPTKVFMPDTQWFRENKFFVEMFHLVLEMHLEELYPALYLITIIHPEFPDILYTGLQEPDGTVLHLPTHVHQSLILGRDNLAGALKTNTFGYLFIPPSDYYEGHLCLDPVQCAEAQKDIIQTTFTPHIKPYVAFSHPSTSPSNFMPGMCTSCTAHIMPLIPEKQRGVWRQLPALLLLPEWSKLKNFVD